MKTPSPRIPRIQQSPRNNVELWIPWLRHNLEPHGQTIQVEWHFTDHHLVNLVYGVGDEPYFSGYEYAGVEPVYLEDLIDTPDSRRWGIFQMRPQSVLFDWWHDQARFFGKAYVVVTEEFLVAQLPTDDSLAPLTKPGGLLAPVVRLDEHLRRRRADNHPDDPTSGGLQDE